MQDNQHGSQMNEVEKFDEWVKKFFLDPETCALDHQLFSIDIYESDDEYMVEAVLENHEVEDIKVCLSDNELSIIVDEAHKPLIDNKADTIPTQRNIPFPFSICTRRITAEFSNPILVIRIHKFSPGKKAEDINIE
ncbi:Hsp20/alpha crystallin family protein [Peribacillus muralis]|uniref:Hsp20/alpha crystallin family protein n=1 Tax=Peribacillus muralis TaxID=264697 RepID=UPI00070E149E|nr:Hsp20/alpha crystallin family protein [Peribacillus muralis]MCK1993803.1 Hsp20/alpha crystallin family protein [Peribacillus muralis]MCK2013908.1 Hsp20/alpha crystallin family protein [Peribacillus muralis]